MPRVSPFIWIVSALMVLALILLLVFASCVPPEQSEAPTAAGIFATKTELQALQNVVSQKADNTAVDAVSKRVDSVNTRIDNLSGAGAAAGYTKAETYTKAEVDAMIAKLKSDQSWITGAGSSTPPPAGGSVTVITSPTAVQTMGTQQVCYTMKIQNTTAQWVYVRPIINVNLHTGQSPLLAPLNDGNITITMGGSVGSYADANFQVTGTTSSAILIPTAGGSTATGEMQIAANATADLLVCVTVTGVDARIWNISSSVNWRSL